MFTLQMLFNELCREGKKQNITIYSLVVEGSRCGILIGSNIVGYTTIGSLSKLIITPQPVSH